MPSLEEFESALKDVVSSKRVSLSKMNKLSEVAKRGFENDVQMVSMLYRTHKALEPQFKVPSLYAFDALARAARAHALKHGTSGDAQSGNSATFLLKLEAVLDGLFQDMMSCGVSEGKVSKNHTWLNPLITPGRISCVSFVLLSLHRTHRVGSAKAGNARYGNCVAPSRGMYFHACRREAS